VRLIGLTLFEPEFRDVGGLAIGGDRDPNRWFPTVIDPPVRLVATLNHADVVRAVVHDVGVWPFGVIAILIGVFPTLIVPRPVVWSRG